GARATRRPLVDAGLLRDRVEDRVALLLAATVGHGEERVGPVLVGGELVAVRDAAEGGALLAGLQHAVVGHLPDAHAVGREPGPAVEEDGRHAAEETARGHAPGG